MQILNKFKLAENIATPFHRIYSQIPQKYFQSTNVLLQLSRDKKKKTWLELFLRSRKQHKFVFPPSKPSAGLPSSINSQHRPACCVKTMFTGANLPTQTILCISTSSCGSKFAQQFRSINTQSRGMKTCEIDFNVYFWLSFLLAFPHFRPRHVCLGKCLKNCQALLSSALLIKSIRTLKILCQKLFGFSKKI